MKKFLVWVIGLSVIVAAAAFIFYRFYLPGLVADAIMEEHTPRYVPTFVEARMKKFKAPLNKGTSDVIKEIHRSNVTLEQLLAAVDNTEPAQVHAALDELNNSKVKNTNDVFEIGKKYVQADFDVEVLRKPFNENVDMTMVKRALGYAEGRNDEDAVDPEMAKAVIKQLLIQKEKEYRQSMNN
jgi:hypothetical protein